MAQIHGISVEDLSILGDYLELPDVSHADFGDKPEEVNVPSTSEQPQTSTAAESHVPVTSTVKVNSGESADDIDFENDVGDAEDPEIDMDDIPRMKELLKGNIEELNRRFREKIAAEAAQRAEEAGDSDYEEGELPQNNQFPAEEFEKVYVSAAEKAGWVKYPPPAHIPSYVDTYLGDFRKSEGKIIAWAWLHEFKVWGVKRERGVEYYENCKTLATLPYYDWMAMARLKMLNPSKVEYMDLFEKRLKWGFNVSWKKEKLKEWQSDFIWIPQFATKFEMRHNPVTCWVKTAI